MFTKPKPMNEHTINNLSHALNIAQLTDTGLVRARNEDTIASDARLGFAILADGMGGYNAGDVASQMAVSVIMSALSAQLQGLATLGQPFNHAVASAYLLEAVQLANQAIYQAAQTQAHYAEMGTTLVTSLFVDNQVIIGHIGDSRAYVLRNGRLHSISSDHSVLQQQLDAGMITAAQAKLAIYKNYVTKALGVDPAADLELNTYDVMVGDIYLLCSDGLNDMLEDSEIASLLLAEHSAPNAATLAMTARALVEKANQRGGQDNISVILIEITAAFPSEHTLWYQTLLNKVVKKG